MGLLVVFLAGVGGLFVCDPVLGRLAASMAKVDVYGFGGFGSFPVLFAEAVRVRGWLDAQGCTDAMALALVAPGPPQLAAIVVGYQIKGLLGAVVGAVSVLCPSLLIILGAAPARAAILRSDWARKAVAGVLATVGGMVVGLTLRLGQALPLQWPQIALLAGGLVALALKVEAIWVVLAGCVIGALLF